METTFLSEKAKEIIAEIRSTDGYKYGSMSRKAAICETICKIRMCLIDDDDYDREALSAVVQTLSEYNELLTELSKNR